MDRRIAIAAAAGVIVALAAVVVIFAGSDERGGELVRAEAEQVQMLNSADERVQPMRETWLHPC